MNVNPASDYLARVLREVSRTEHEFGWLDLPLRIQVEIESEDLI
jgi:hypothetical protein